MAGSSPVSRSKPGFGQVFSDGANEWSVPRLIELAAELVPEQVPLSEFEELDEVVWSDDMTVREVLEHTRRILDADLTCPVIRSADGWIMDGSQIVSKLIWVCREDESRRVPATDLSGLLDDG